MKKITILLGLLFIFSGCTQESNFPVEYEVVELKVKNNNLIAIFPDNYKVQAKPIIIASEKLYKDGLVYGITDNEYYIKINNKKYRNIWSWKIIYIDKGEYFQLGNEEDYANFKEKIKSDSYFESLLKSKKKTNFN